MLFKYCPFWNYILLHLTFPIYSTTDYNRHLIFLKQEFIQYTDNIYVFYAELFKEES